MEQAQSTPPFIVPLWFGLMAVVTVALVVHRQRTADRRRAAIDAFLAASGWSRLEGAAHLARQWRGSPFDWGLLDPQANEVLTGRVRGFDVVSFDYSYKTNKHRMHFHVVALRLPVPLPLLELGPEGILGVPVPGFTDKDHQLESEAFNKAWKVTSPDPRFAHAILTPRLMEWLMTAQGERFRIEGADVLTWRSGTQRLDTILHDADRLAIIAAAVPTHVWREHGFDPAAAPDAR